RAGTPVAAPDRAAPRRAGKRATRRPPEPATTGTPPRRRAAARPSRPAAAAKDEAGHRSSVDVAPLAILAGIMLKPSGLDRSTVRARFNAHPTPRDRADFLYREVERRMLERLDLVKLDPVKRVL